MTRFRMGVMEAQSRRVYRSLILPQPPRPVAFNDLAANILAIGMALLALVHLPGFSQPS